MIETISKLTNAVDKGLKKSICRFTIRYIY